MAFGNKGDSHCVFKNKRLRNVMPKIFKFPRKESYSFINSFYVVLENIGFLKLNLIVFFLFYLIFTISWFVHVVPVIVLIFSNVVKGTTKFYGVFFFFLQTKQWNFNIINSLKKEENSQFKIKLILIIPNTRSLNWWI
jgi:glucan phosphoethanolaminetransferase (alkaline phosphatase superfamily)